VIVSSFDSNILDLTLYQWDTLFVVCNTRNNVNSLFSSLYELKYSFNDYVLCCGNFFNFEFDDFQKLEETYEIIFQIPNLVVLQGQQEYEFVNNIESILTKIPKCYYRLLSQLYGYCNVMPVVCKISDSTYCTSGGIVPVKGWQNYSRDTFVNIKTRQETPIFYKSLPEDVNEWYQYNKEISDKIIFPSSITKFVPLGIGIDDNTIVIYNRKDCSYTLYHKE